MTAFHVIASSASSERQVSTLIDTMHLTRFPLLRPASRSFATVAGEQRVKKPLTSLNDNARHRAERLSADWKGTNASGGTTKNYIGGEFVESSAKNWIQVLDPVRGCFATFVVPNELNSP